MKLILLAGTKIASVTIVPSTRAAATAAEAAN
jgi:hypothetical protein